MVIKFLKKLNSCLLAIVVLLCSVPQMVWSDPATMTDADLVQIQQKALLGGQNEALEVWGFYGWGKGQEYSGAAAKERYWLQIAAENGGGLNYLEFAQVLQNYFSASGKSAAGINDNIRSFYWAKMASLHPNSAQTYASANDELSGAYPMRISYWKSVSRHFSFCQPVANEATQLESETPSLIPLNMLGVTSQGNAASALNPYDTIEINRSNLPILEVNALLGDASAAAALANYFQTAKDKSEIYWQTIAAEDGDVTSQFWLAEQLSNSTDRNDRIRAVFWATKVSEQSKDAVLADQAKNLLLTLGNEHIATVDPLETLP